MDKKTKIVATIGPASSSKEVLREMIMAGMNVARINFSHGTYESNGSLIDIIHELSKETGKNIAVMADLQGPRIRVGNETEFEIAVGEIITVSHALSSGGEKELVIDSDNIVGSFKIGERILIEDGTKELRVVEKTGNGVKAEVVTGGTVKPRKGINVPDTEVPFGAVTEKDEKDLEFALSKDVDFVALSFVSNGKEIEETREKMKQLLGRDTDIPGIVSKVERKEAIKNIDEIIKASDAVMVARGDLGIELDETNVVIYQKQIISKCMEIARPVIVATQMLDSMIKNPLPTRAEVSDVSNAVIDHADAVMLSGESANGDYPVKAVETMTKIIRNTEESPFDDYCKISEHAGENKEYAALVCSAYDMAKESGAKAILCVSRSGFTARMLALRRPQEGLLVATGSKKTYSQLALVWGVEAYLFSDGEKMEDYLTLMTQRAKEDGRLVLGDKIVVFMGGFPGGEKMRLVGIKEIV